MPDLGSEHRNGQRLPDMGLVLKDSSRTTLYRLLEDGRWVRLQFTPDQEVSSDAGTINPVSLAPGANDGLLANFGARAAGWLPCPCAPGAKYPIDEWSQTASTTPFRSSIHATRKSVGRRGSAGAPLLCRCDCWHLHLRHL
jgi:hypothetical protein